MRISGMQYMKVICFQTGQAIPCSFKIVEQGYGGYTGGFCNFPCIEVPGQVSYFHTALENGTGHTQTYFFRLQVGICI